MTSNEPEVSWAPRGGALWAWLIFVLAALTIFHPMLTGQFLGGDDQVIAGYGFREFAAAFHKEYGRIPQWNPYLFGGLPFFGVIGHGDIFYPTAWLRWFVATDFGMTLGFFLHVVLAGGTMYALLRGLRLGWTAAVTGGLAFEMSGIVLSQISPGHDGKLFVTALAPLAFLALLRGFRTRNPAWFGLLAVVIGLSILSPQVQMAYYLLVACGLWALWLAFRDPERVAGQSPILPLGLSALAVALGLGIAAIQLMPIFDYVQWTPRAEGGDSGGWDYATSYSWHLKELPTLVLPQFNGVLEHYWGDNALKAHTEYLGAIVAVLAILGLAVVRARKMLLGFVGIAVLFLLVSLGADTPFYRLWYEVMPTMKNVRAAGMAFYLVALVLCVWAAHGVEALVSGTVTRKRLLWPLGVLAALALLGAVGALQPFAEAFAHPQLAAAAMGNAGELRAGAIRLLVVVIVGGAVLLAVQGARLRGVAAAAALLAVVHADQWTVLRQFATWLPPAPVTYDTDSVIAAMNARELPYRTWDPAGQVGGAGLYQGSILMAHKVPTVFGYHGMESRFYDEVWGGKNSWLRQLSPTLQDLWAVQFVTINQPIDSLAGFHQVQGPVSFPNLFGRTAPAGFLWERDTPARWVRVVPTAMKLPEAQVSVTVADAGFPVNGVALYPDTSSIPDATPAGPLTDSTSLVARLTHWEPGAMTIAIDGSEERTRYLVVAENWYPDWRATVDGVEAPVYRANGAMLSVALPSGSREVTLRFAMASYDRGRMVTLLSLVGAVGLVGAGVFRRRRIDG